MRRGRRVDVDAAELEPLDLSRRRAGGPAARGRRSRVLAACGELLERARPRRRRAAARACRRCDRVLDEVRRRGDVVGRLGDRELDAAGGRRSCRAGRGRPAWSACCGSAAVESAPPSTTPSARRASAAAARQRQGRCANRRPMRRSTSVNAISPRPQAAGGARRGCVVAGAVAAAGAVAVAGAWPVAGAASSGRAGAVAVRRCRSLCGRRPRRAGRAGVPVRRRRRRGVGRVRRRRAPPRRLRCAGAARAARASAAGSAPRRPGRRRRPSTARAPGASRKQIDPAAASPCRASRRRPRCGSPASSCETVARSLRVLALERAARSTARPMPAFSFSSETCRKTSPSSSTPTSAIRRGRGTGRPAGSAAGTRAATRRGSRGSAAARHRDARQRGGARGLRSAAMSGTRAGRAARCARGRRGGARLRAGDGRGGGRGHASAFLGACGRRAGARSASAGSATARRRRDDGRRGRAARPRGSWPQAQTGSSGGQMQPRARSARKRFTRRSSSEWNEIPAKRPSSRRSAQASGSAASSCAELVVDRDAERLEERLAGWPPAKRAGAGIARDDRRRRARAWSSIGCRARARARSRARSAARSAPRRTRAARGRAGARPTR